MKMALERFDPFDGALGLSLATRVGSLVYTSGMVGVDPVTLAAPEDLEAEIRLAFSNLEGILQSMGTSFDHVLEQTNFLVGDPEVVYPIFQEVRTEVFAGCLPASTSVFVQALVSPAFHCEVKLVAAVPE
jgi:enamine deaminase RidA (YjgF/YER057c/UK114 family)